MRYNSGDVLVVLGDWQKMHHGFPIGTVVQVIRSRNAPQLGYVYDVISPSGSAYWVHEKDLETYNKNTETMKAMKDAVLTVAKGLCKANNTVTTLEVKVELRRDYPYYFWTQQTVSDYMSQLAGDGILTYTDNGTYRTCSLANQSQTAGPVSKSISASNSGTATFSYGVPVRGIAKVSGKVPSGGSITSGSGSQLATGKRGRGRPRKIAIITQGDALNMASASGFQGVVINRRNGLPIAYTKADIKAQKKSPFAFINRSFGKIAQITVDGTTYVVN